MKSIYLIKKGNAAEAFEFRETPKPAPADDEVIIQVEYSGLNFADILARKGMYKEAPPIPCVLGYDVSGTIESAGKNINGLKPGDRVAAFTRFGGYSEYVAASGMGVVKIPDTLDGATADALTTQYVTAFYCAAETTNLHEGDSVLIHAAAGGVGTALVQYALYKKCTVFATAGSAVKVEMLNKTGVQYAINYRKDDYRSVIKNHAPGGLDAIFDSLGGRFVKDGIRLLSAGGRIICFGAAEMSGSSSIFHQIKTGLAFGFYHPAQFIIPSKSLIGVNMLRIADTRPVVLKRCMEEVMGLYNKGVFKPLIGKIFPASEIAKAHEYVESRESIGKVLIKWP